MRESMRKLISRLPLSFRVLYRQFLLRVIDLEALSIEADIPRFLGQFAGVLIMISLLQVLGALWNAGQIQELPPAVHLALVWSKEQSLISYFPRPPRRHGALTIARPTAHHPSC